VCEAHGRVRRVDALATGAGRAKAIHADVLLVDLDVHVLGLGQDRDRGGRSMDAAGGLGRGHSLDAVDAAFVLQARVRALALDQRRDRLDPADSGVVAVHDLDLPAPAFGVALVHAEELRREERGLVAARTGADLDEDVARIVGVLRQE
jgi:hypothetical protein